MSIDEKKDVREYVRSGNWRIIWAAGETPLPDQKVRVLFEYMSGGIGETDAVCRWDFNGNIWFEGTTGQFRGNKIVRVMAWKADTLEFVE